MKSTRKQLIENKIRSLVKEVLNEATFKTVKVTYSNGLSITTSVNPNVSEADIYKYFKVGSSVNIGTGGQDKVVKIANVEILGDEEF